MPARQWRGRIVAGVGRWVAGLSPRACHRLARWLLRVPGLTTRRRRIAAVNLALCFPQLDTAARSALLARTLESNTVGVLESLRAWFAPLASLHAGARITGLAHLHAALAEGRGVILVGAHGDGIELTMRHVAEAAGLPIANLWRRHNDPGIEATLSQARARYAGRSFDKKDVAGLAAHVQAGHAVFYLPDQDAARRTVFVPFFGVPAATLGAMGGVLRRCGGKVLLMWARRDAEGVQHIDLQPAWPDWPEQDDTRTAARYMAWIEARLQAAPEQYLWVHRRFKTRPPGQPGFY